MADDVFTLFDDYAARFARGERPDARAYLARAGEGADELAGLMDAYLARAEPPRRTTMREWQRRRGWRGERRCWSCARVAACDETRSSTRSRERSGSIRAAREGQGVLPRTRDGQLDPRGVDRSVLEALGETLRARAADLLAWRPRPPEPAMVFYRAAEPQSAPLASAARQESPSASRTRSIASSAGPKRKPC
jgi:hypothetical protein